MLLIFPSFASSLLPSTDFILWFGMPCSSALTLSMALLWGSNVRQSAVYSTRLFCTLAAYFICSWCNFCYTSGIVIITTVTTTYSYYNNSNNTVTVWLQKLSMIWWWMLWHSSWSSLYSVMLIKLQSWNWKHWISSMTSCASRSRNWLECQRLGHISA